MRIVDVTRYRFGRRDSTYAPFEPPTDNTNRPDGEQALRTMYKALTPPAGSRGAAPRTFMCLLALSLSVGAAHVSAGTRAAAKPGPSSTPPPAQPATAPRVVSRSQVGAQYMARRYGVDQIRVHYTASGASIEFRYRVVDPDKAALLNDKSAEPVMIDERTGVKLQVPVMEQIGALRQVTPPERGREYWMLFNNRGKVVRPGGRVDVSIGAFHARALVVE
jgi:hypothetical protein